MSMYLARIVPVDHAHTAIARADQPARQVLRLRRSGARRVGGGRGHARNVALHRDVPAILGRWLRTRSPVSISTRPTCLLTTTKQVRKRLDLTRPVPYEVLLECIDIANHAPMGGNLERNRWMIIDDADTKAKISEYFGRSVARTWPPTPTRRPTTAPAR